MTDYEPRSQRDYTRPVSAADEVIDIQRYREAFRRDSRLVVLIVLVAGALALIISLTAQSQYRSTASIVFEEIGGVSQNQDVGRLQRVLATLQVLVKTPPVLEEAARRQGLSASALEKNVAATVNRDANIITVTATDDDPATAAAAANAVATAFLGIRGDLERARLVRARAALQRELDRLRVLGGTVSQTGALRAGISELGVLIAGAGSELQIAEKARPAAAPYSPRPFRNVIIALFAGLFVAVLVVLGRDQVRPRIGNARELGGLLEIPILARIPLTRARDRRTGILTGREYDAYQALPASFRFHSRTSSQRVVLVTSAVPGEGKSSVTAGLGVALAQSGSSTLLISADLRFPTLHELFGVTPQQGLAEILGTVGLWKIQEPARNGRSEQLKAMIVESAEPLRSNLFLIGGEKKHPNASRILSGEALGSFFEEVSELAYDYVILDAPPLLGIAETRTLAMHADSVVVVGRPDRLTPELALDMRDALDTLDAEVLGLVVVGAKADYTTYYGDRRPSDLEMA